MNKNCVKILACFAATLLFCVSLGAQDVYSGKFQVEYIDMDHGLPCNFVVDVHTDYSGFLWIGTSGGGICRWDGFEFLTFDYSSANPIKSNFVRNFTEDRFHRLWVGSDGGLDVIDIPSLKLCNRSLGLEDLNKSAVCRYVTIDSKGSIWFILDSSIFKVRFDDAGNIASVLSYTHPDLEQTNPVCSDVDNDGSVWIRLGTSFYKIEETPEGNGLDRTPILQSLTFDYPVYVSDYLSDGPVVWISTEIGLYKVSRHTGEFKQYTSSSSGANSLTQNFITSLSFSYNGRLVASSLYGLNLYNPVTDDFDQLGKMVVSRVVTVGNITFIATENRGLMICIPKRFDFDNYTSTESPSSIAGGAVNSLYQSSDGRLWVGTVEGGLSVKKENEPGFSHLTMRSGLTHNSVSALRQGPDGSMYVGTWGGGIDVVAGQGPLKVLSHIPGSEGRVDYIGALEYDTLNNLLWVGSNKGIFFYNPSTRQYTEAVSEQPIGCIGSCLDSHGNLWIGSSDGLFRFTLTSRSKDGLFDYTHYRYKMDAPQSMAKERISCIAEVSDQTLYIGSNGGGVYKADLQDDGSYIFTSITTNQGLSNNRVRGICKDTAGYIWISTDHGLNRLDPATGNIKKFLREDGLPENQFYWNNTLAGSDGTLYFGHVSGLLAVDPLSIKSGPGEGVLRFTKLAIGNRVFNDPFMTNLSMHESEKYLTVSFTALTAGSRISYEYRMKGYDKEWITVSPGKNTVVYSSLPAGKYTLQVRAMDDLGENLGELSLHIKVRPYFYSDWWFHLLLVAFVLAVVYLIIIWRTRALIHRQVILEETVQKRTSEISEQKRLVEEKAEELNRQNEVLLRQNEEMASIKLFFSPERNLSAKIGKDDKFLEKIADAARKHYRNPDLDVATFCEEMGMSKTMLNKKLQEVLGSSIGQFIRSYRLSVAKEILQNDRSMNISEVAYEVGFNDPKYFTRCFTKEFNINPSAILK